MGSLIAQVLQLYLLIMIGRLVFDYVQMFARSWTPSGFLLLLVETIYSLTDPPLNFFRRFIPPLRIGSISLDMSFIVVIILIQIAIGIFSSL
ncbi:MAG: YggT family protein [Candidatus Nanopelagicales bacterium]|jgi:YggT family protein|nr:YggT family protein [Actinomycetota bacterium]MDA2977905.1 YggT family protein [Actinomycetota bacterium]MDA3026217.1 YggT family protein [Actinomycetota bacterium]MDP4986142.1 YggT family protein [Candidatus Nanopelagicales bacterium]MDP5107692.1 YggT family protein [Candidatus Nanopelagicales bacterium]